MRIEAAEPLQIKRDLLCVAIRRKESKTEGSRQNKALVVLTGFKGIFGTKQSKRSCRDFQKIEKIVFTGKA